MVSIFLSLIYLVKIIVRLKILYYCDILHDWVYYNAVSFSTEQTWYSLLWKIEWENWDDGVNGSGGCNYRYPLMEQKRLCKNINHNKGTRNYEKVGGNGEELK